MSIIPITVFFSLLLAGGFAALFVREQRRRKFASAERDSLLPLADEAPRLAGPAATEDGAHADDHDHAESEPHHHHHHGKGGCGCANGERPPCAGCLRRPRATAPVISAHSRATPSP